MNATPSTGASEPQAAVRRRPRTPYLVFTWRSKGPVLPVDESPAAQAQARALVAAGMCAYENRRGFIRDLAAPAKKKHAGRVFGFEPPAEDG